MDDRTLLIVAAVLLVAGTALALREKAWPLGCGLAGIALIAVVLIGKL